jgi:ABC-type lipoprotein export system ATPase subunit
MLLRLARDSEATIVCATHDPIVIEHADVELKLG